MKTDLPGTPPKLNTSLSTTIKHKTMRKNYFIPLALMLVALFITSKVKATRVNFASTDVFATVYATMSAGDTLWLTTPGTTAPYANLTAVSITKAITFMGDSTIASRPILTQAVFTATAATYSKIEFVGFESYYFAPTAVATSNYFFIATANPNLSIGTVKFKNCTIHGYGRAMLRSDNSSLNVTINNLISDNCLFYDFGRVSASYSVFAMKGAITSNISFTNTTFYGSPDGIYLTNNTNQLSFLMKNCTVIEQGNYTSGTAAAPVAAAALISFGAANASSTFTIQDCIISGSFTNKNSSPMAEATYFGATNATAANIIKFNTATTTNVNLINSVVLGNTFSTPTTPGGTNSPITTTSLTSDFSSMLITTVTAPGTFIANIGDPKWSLNPSEAPVTNPATSITSNGFTANWNSFANATGYYLDVSANASFSNFIATYKNYDVGNGTSFAVTGLSPLSTYYYRLRAYNIGSTNNSSPAISVTTLPGISTDASLSDLKVGGISVPAFAPGTITYNVTLPVGTSLTPAITATMNEQHASMVINQPSSVNGSATVVVTAQDGVTKTTYTINLSALSTSNDATLSSLKINNVAITGFAAGTLTYNITSYAAGTAVATLPITYALNESHATAVLTAPTAIPGVGTILVIAQDGITKLTYTINFKVTDATLSDLKIGGITIRSFAPASVTDTISWPNDGTIPVITYTPTESHATALVTIQPGVFGNATVVVTAQDGTTTKTYTILIRSNDASLRDLQVNGTTITGFSPTTLAYTVNYAYYNVMTGSVALPVVTAAINESHATMVAPAAITAFPSTSTIAVTAQDGTKVSYTIYFGITTGVNDITEQQLKISSKAGVVDILSGYNILSLQVADIQGKKVLAKNINSTEASVSTLGWVNGIYIFSLVTENGVITRKIGIFQ